MKLSTILKAIRGKVFSFHSTHEFHHLDTAHAKRQSTPIYDSHCSVNYDLQAADFRSSESPTPQPHQTLPKSQALLPRQRSVIRKTKFKHKVTYSSYHSHSGTSDDLNNDNKPESEQPAPIAAPQPISVPQASAALPVI